jgi:hypothetical protein
MHIYTSIYIYTYTYIYIYIHHKDKGYMTIRVGFKRVKKVCKQ